MIEKRKQDLIEIPRIIPVPWGRNKIIRNKKKLLHLNSFSIKGMEIGLRLLDLVMDRGPKLKIALRPSKKRTLLL